METKEVTVTRTLLLIYGAIEARVHVTYQLFGLELLFRDNNAQVSHKLAATVVGGVIRWIGWHWRSTQNLA